MFWLYENGRGFDERTHRHTANYDFVSVAYKDDDGVPVELALDHNYAGLGVVFTEPAEGVSSEEFITLARVLGRPGALRRRRPGLPLLVGGERALPGAPHPGGARWRWAPGGATTTGSCSCASSRTEPTECWDAFRDYAAAIDAGGRRQGTFAAPFLPTIVGTDTYTDQLW